MKTTIKPAPANCTVRGATWLQAEEYAYPAGGFTRRAYVQVRRNPNPSPDVSAIVGRLRIVRCSIPDTCFSIPARLRVRGATIRGFVSVIDEAFTFTPDAL